MSGSVEWGAMPDADEVRAHDPTQGALTRRGGAWMRRATSGDLAVVYLRVDASGVTWGRLPLGAVWRVPDWHDLRAQWRPVDDEGLPLPNPGTPAVTARESHEGRVGCQGPGCACDTRSMERHPAGS